MSELNHQLEEFGIELEQIISGSEHKRAIDEYHVTSQKLSPLLESLELVTHQIELMTYLPERFNSISIDGELAENLITTEAIIEKLKEDWEQVDFELRQMESFANTLDITKKISQKLQEELMTNWNEWIGELKSNFQISPELLESQKNIPSLSAVYSDFIKYLFEFESLSSNIPDSKDTVDRLIKLSKLLNELLAQMDFDVPSSVEKLFDHLNRSYGNSYAPLSMVNDEVMQWLIDTGEINNFVIKRK